MVARELSLEVVSRRYTQALECRCLGLVTLQHLGSSWTRDQSHVPCIDRQILNQWTTREVWSILCLRDPGSSHHNHVPSIGLEKGGKTCPLH